MELRFSLCQGATGGGPNEDDKHRASMASLPRRPGFVVQSYFVLALIALHSHLSAGRCSYNRFSSFEAAQLYSDIVGQRAWASWNCSRARCLSLRRTASMPMK